MMRLAITGLLLLMTGYTIAQEVIWADTVLEVSSEWRVSKHLSTIGDESYKAYQVLGHPNIYPGSKGSTRAWAPKKQGDIDYIKVGFKKPIHIKQVAIAETLNPTAIWQVYAYDSIGTEYLLNQFQPRPIPLNGRLMNVFIDKTPYKVHAVKVVLDCSKVPGHNGIDAIAISDSDIPVKIDVHFAEGIYASVAPEKLNDNINTHFKELKPLITPDGKGIYFSRARDPHNIGGHKDPEDIWYAEKDNNGEWQKAINVGPPLNTKGPNYVSSIIPFKTGYLMLLGNKYKGDRVIDGLSMTYHLDSTFSSVKNLVVENMENFSPFASYFMSQNQKAILMSVQRRDTYGNRDLYVSLQKPNGNYATPLNLGEVINTSDEESSPFLAPDGRTLFFSSKGHLGFGGSDLFIAHRLDDTWQNWSMPENLGPIVNNEDDQLFFQLEYDSKYAYYVNGTGHDADIYRIELPVMYLPEPFMTIYGKVLDKNSLQPLEGVDIMLVNTDKNFIEAEVYTEADGFYSFALPIGAVYDLSIEKDGYLSIDHDPIDLHSLYESDSIYRDILMTPVEVGQRVSLDNIYFDFDKAELRPESMPQLNKVLSFLEKNKNVTIQLDGHTCSMGRDDYNQKLSEDRAQSVMLYLVENGVKQKRLSSFGFGESKPVAANDSEEGRETNRRVEFTIVSN